MTHRCMLKGGHYLAFVHTRARQYMVVLAMQDMRRLASSVAATPMPVAQF